MLMMINQVYSPLVQATPRAGMSICELQVLSSEESSPSTFPMPCPSCSLLAVGSDYFEVLQALIIQYKSRKSLHAPTSLLLLRPLLPPSSSPSSFTPSSLLRHLPGFLPQFRFSHSFLHFLLSYLLLHFLPRFLLLGLAQICLTPRCIQACV